MNRTLKTFLGSLAILSVSSGITVSAQGYYDDDIYYDASKAKKEKEAKALERAKAVARSNYRPSQSIADYAAADTYTVNSGSTRDVDEYNRRYPSTFPVPLQIRQRETLGGRVISLFMISFV